jgi:GTPase SAR1 family protein
MDNIVAAGRQFFSKALFGGGAEKEAQEEREEISEFTQDDNLVPVHELTLMLIGDGEVGKTSLQRAFVALDHKAEWIGKDERTVGIDFSELVFGSPA